MRSFIVSGLLIAAGVIGLLSGSVVIPILCGIAFLINLTA